MGFQGDDSEGEGYCVDDNPGSGARSNGSGNYHRIGSGSGHGRSISAVDYTRHLFRVWVAGVQVLVFHEIER